MGGGGYSVSSRHARAENEGYYTKSANETFSQRGIFHEMNPYGVTLRESRDSDEHPDAYPIIIALDVTGSMGQIPHELVRNGLPTIMSNIISSGIQHPQVLFLAIGDHECDRSPLQIGQFESSDEKLDYWLTNVYLEGGGGGNLGESYALAWLFASRYTETDSFAKRGRKGVLITIGDEPTLNDYSARMQKALFGDGQCSDATASSLLADACQSYHCFHLNTSFTMSGRRTNTVNKWRELMSDHLLIAESIDEISAIISKTVEDCFLSETKETPAEKRINPVINNIDDIIL